MKAVTAVVWPEADASLLSESLAGLAIIVPTEARDPRTGGGLAALLDGVVTDYLLLVLPGGAVSLGQRALERLLAVAEDSDAGWVYSDFRDEAESAVVDHPLVDYQLGSLRDSFDFGSLVLVSTAAARAALDTHGAPEADLRWGALYDLRLKMSTAALPLRIPEPLYSRRPADQRSSGERIFDYVDPRRREYQVEMERIATAHLERIGAYLAPHFEAPPLRSGSFPVRASVVIPVRNRERTIEDAVRSALGQRASFEHNVIVVDNHSTDRTTEILAGLARSDRRLVHIVPARRDLGIGGCWNEAVASEACGEHAVQLDSDDVYSVPDALERMVAAFDEGPYVMVIGAYTVVSFELAPLPPGVVDHREWTRDNGRNNALRIGGLGAPRAFHVPLLRRVGLPNVSYGEDYATALRLSRRYEIGRIYEPLYFARRWEGNSDAALPIATANRYDAYKDHVRSVEVRARQRLNREMAGPTPR
jgi:hypothetical protein